MTKEDKKFIMENMTKLASYCESRNIVMVCAISDANDKDNGTACVVSGKDFVCRGLIEFLKTKASIK